MQLYLKKYHISFIITEAGTLPAYTGSTIEGSFGRALEEINQKLYGQLNEIQTDEKNKSFRYTKTNPPRPYIIYPITNGGRKNAGDRLSFEFSLLGKYSTKFKYLLPIFKNMGKTGFGSHFLKAEFVGVEDILSPITFQSEFNYEDYQGLTFDKKKLIVNFLSPVSFNSQSRMDYDHGFNEFYKRLYLRFFILNHLYGDKSVPDIEHFDYDVDLIENHHKRVDNIYHKSKDKKSYILHGAKLQLRYKADSEILDEVYPLVKFGELIHIGANTVYGFGRYIIDS